MSFTSGPYAEHAQRVLQDDEDSIPLNTRVAYASKGEEFLSFCDKIYGERSRDEVSARTVTEEKVFAFLFYQSYRKVRKKGLKRSSSGKENARGLNLQEEGGSKLGEVVGFDVVNQYYCSVLKIWRSQTDNNCNNVSKEQLKSERVSRLLNVVKKRKKRVERELYKEKFGEDMMPYSLVNQVPRIEELLWEKNNKVMQHSQSGFAC